MKKRKKIHDSFFQYLDATQHLWNTCFVSRVKDLAQAEPLQTYEQIDRLLFRSMVCDELEIRLPADFDFGFDSVPRVILKPNTRKTGEVPMMLAQARKLQSKYWGPEKLYKSAGVAIEFIEFFQWNNYGYLSKSLIKGRLQSMPAHREFEGYLALVAPDHVTFSME